MRTAAKLILPVAVAVGLVGLAVGNPLNWFTNASTRFSRENFEAVRQGMSREDLVGLLGEPLRIVKPEASGEPLTYYFMGDPPSWLPGFQEAWVYVSPSGVVQGKVWNVEP